MPAHAIRKVMKTRTSVTAMNKTKQLPHATAIDLPSKNRAALVEILNQQLANVSDLQSQTKQAHWNVRGPEFYQLHKLFDDLAEPLAEHIDTLAERAVTLGGFALGTVRCASGCFLDTSGCFATRYVDNGVDSGFRGPFRAGG